MKILVLFELNFLLRKVKIVNEGFTDFKLLGFAPLHDSLMVLQRSWLPDTEYNNRQYGGTMRRKLTKGETLFNKIIAFIKFKNKQPMCYYTVRYVINCKLFLYFFF